jgi:hypothetical protein
MIRSSAGRAAIAAAVTLLLVLAAAPSALAGWADGPGSGTAKAAALTAPVITATASAGCTGSGGKKVVISATGLPIASGRLEVAEATSSNGQSFISGTTTKAFTGGAISYDSPVGKSGTYYYKARVLTPAGTAWTGPISAEVSATC